MHRHGPHAGPPGDARQHGAIGRGRCRPGWRGHGQAAAAGGQQRGGGRRVLEEGIRTRNPCIVVTTNQYSVVDFKHLSEAVLPHVCL